MPDDMPFRDRSVFRRLLINKLPGMAKVPLKGARGGTISPVPSRIPSQEGVRCPLLNAFSNQRNVKSMSQHDN